MDLSPYAVIALACMFFWMVSVGMYYITMEDEEIDDEASAIFILGLVLCWAWPIMMGLSVMALVIYVFDRAFKMSIKR